MRLSALSLKLIAIAAMVVDHVAFTFVPYGTPLWTVMDAAGSSQSAFSARSARQFGCHRLQISRMGKE